jgi:hypothetical protein
MGAERNVRLVKRGSVPIVVTDDVRCPYTIGKEWDGKCFDGQKCEKPYLDSILTSFLPRGYCQQRRATLYELEMIRKGLENTQAKCDSKNQTLKLAYPM